HSLSRELAASRGIEQISQVAVQELSSIFQCHVVVLLPDETRRLHVVAGDMDAVFQQDILKEMKVAQWAYREGQIPGWGPRMSQVSETLAVPQQADLTLGVLALRPADPQSPEWLLPEQLRLRFLESLAKQIALALAVERLHHPLAR